MHDVSYSPLHKGKLPAVIWGQLPMAESGAYRKSEGLSGSHLKNNISLACLLGTDPASWEEPAGAFLS